MKWNLLAPCLAVMASLALPGGAWAAKPRLSAVEAPVAPNLAPAFDAAAFAECPPEELLARSIDNPLDQRNYRSILAALHPHTDEGRVGQAWTAPDPGTKAALYEQVAEDPSAMPQPRAIAAYNRIGLLPEDAQARAISQSVHTIVETDEAWLLPTQDIRDDVGWPVLTDALRRHPELVRRHPHSHSLLLLRKAALIGTDASRAEARARVEQLWSTDPREFGDGFDFEYLLRFRLDEDLFPRVSRVRLLLRSDMTRALQSYLDELAEEPYSFRYFEVSRWMLSLMEAVAEEDARYGEHHEEMVSALLGPRGESLRVAPSARAIALLHALWDSPRVGTWPIQAKGRQWQLWELEAATRSEPACASARWHLTRAEVWLQLGELERAMEQATTAMQRSYDLDDHTDALGIMARIQLRTNQSVGPVLARMEALFPSGPGGSAPTNEGLLHLAGEAAELAAGVGDLEAAARWTARLADNPATSAAYLAEREADLARLTAAMGGHTPEEMAHNGTPRCEAFYGPGARRLSREEKHRLRTCVADLFQAHPGSRFDVVGHSSLREWQDAPGVAKERSDRAFKAIQGAAPPANKYIEVNRESRWALEPRSAGRSEDEDAPSRRVEVVPVAAPSEAVAHLAAIPSELLDLSSSGRLLLTGGGTVWNPDARTPLFAVGLEGGQAGFSPDGRRLFVVDQNNLAMVFDTRSGAPTHLVPVFERQGPLASFAWSPDSSRLLLSVDGSVGIYDLEARAYTHRIDTQLPTARSTHVAWIHGGDAVLLVPQSSRSLFYTVALDSGVVRERRAEFGWAHALATSPDARYAYVSDDQGIVLEWDTADASSSLGPNLVVVDQQIGQRVRLAGRELQVHPLYPRVVVTNSLHTPHFGIVDFEHNDLYVGSPDPALHASRPRPVPFFDAARDRLLISGDWHATRALKAARGDPQYGLYEANLGHRQLGAWPYNVDEADTHRGLENDQLSLFGDTPHRVVEVQPLAHTDQLLVRTPSAVELWSLSARERVHRWPIQVERLVPGRRGHREAHVLVEQLEAGRTELLRLDLADFSVASLASLERRVSAIDLAGDHLVLGAGPMLPPDQGSAELELVVVPLEDPSSAMRRSVETTTERLRTGRITSTTFEAVAISPSGHEVAFITRWGDGYGYGTTQSDQLRRWVVGTDTLAAPRHVGRSVDELHYDTDTRLRVSSPSDTRDSVLETEAMAWGPDADRSSRARHHNGADFAGAFGHLGYTLTLEDAELTARNTADDTLAFRLVPLQDTLACE